MSTSPKNFFQESRPVVFLIVVKWKSEYAPQYPISPVMTSASPAMSAIMSTIRGAQKQPRLTKIEPRNTLIYLSSKPSFTVQEEKIFIKK